MYLYIYIYICICMYVCVYIYTAERLHRQSLRPRIPVRLRPDTLAGARTLKPEGLIIYIYSYTDTHTRGQTETHIHVYIYGDMYIFI